MSISAEDMRVLHESLPVVRERTHPIAERFYENLFAMAPEMRSMFRDDLGGQGMRFITTLSAIVSILDEDREAGKAAEALARAHAGLGVRPEHYPPLGNALMVTLGETLGPDFTPERQRSWRAAYDEVAARMMAAATHHSG